MPWKREDMYPGDVVEITNNCDVGSYSERAVVLTVDCMHMTLVFPSRALGKRFVNTGTDYTFLRKV